jgi:hypothetical protein
MPWKDVKSQDVETENQERCQDVETENQLETQHRSRI